ncbi:hypothetical protein Tco_1314268 [Tanacetum coccineum]
MYNRLLQRKWHVEGVSMGAHTANDIIVKGSARAGNDKGCNYDCGVCWEVVLWVAISPRGSWGQKNESGCGTKGTSTEAVWGLKKPEKETEKGLRSGSWCMVTDIKKGTKQRQNRTKPSTGLERARNFESDSAFIFY